MAKKADNNDDQHVVHHLDVDPNDPRNAEPTPELPSLNDPGQSGPVETETADNKA